MGAGQSKSTKGSAAASPNAAPVEKEAEKPVPLPEVRRPRASILTGRSLEAAAARETNNERHYRQLYTGQLEKIAFLNATDREGNEYEAESAIFERASSSLMYAAAGGVGVGLAAFLSLRYIPTMLTKMIGGDAKLQKLREKNLASSPLQKGGMLLFELSFGFWASWRGYHIVTDHMGKGGGYDEISKIPLVQGRSAISDTICEDWVELTYDTIPPEFWHNLTHGEEECKLKDYGAWRAIRSFADNCVKRSRYEDALRRERGLDDGAPVAIPAPGVPEMLSQIPLSEADAKMLVNDAPR